MPIRLHVNIDHVATVRNARGTFYPDPIHAAIVCERSGADGITAHLREDRRHIIDRDVERLRESITTVFNLEMAATDEMVTIACRVRPEIVTLVPERREERTTEGGLDVAGQRQRLRATVDRLREARIRVSLFVAPVLEQLEATCDVGATQVELHTGDYAHARGGEAEREVLRLRTAADRAHALGLEVAAGHGLHLHNVGEIAQLDPVTELNIGHALIADSIFDGLENAVRAYREAIARGIELRKRPSRDPSHSEFEPDTMTSGARR